MRTVLLDVDGTLVDSKQPILQSLSTALIDNGLEAVTGEELGRYVGPPLQLTLSTLLSSRGVDTALVPKLVDDFRTAYRPLSLELAATYPGVAELLEVLRSSVRLGVVTSKPTALAIPILDVLGFSSMMDVIEGPDMAEIEPKTTTLRRALARLQIEPTPDSVTMIGDRRHDVDAGRNCATSTVGVTWGFGSRRELEEARADHVVDRPDEIQRLLGLPG